MRGVVGPFASLLSARVSASMSTGWLFMSVVLLRFWIVCGAASVARMAARASLGVAHRIRPRFLLLASVADVSINE
jgi:hypothetical protein